MHKTFGKRTTREAGLLAPIHFPQLAMMDERTHDGRLLSSVGAGSRELPVTIYAQFIQAPGHETASVVGRLDYVEFHEDGQVSGDGWLVDTEDGRLAYVLCSTGALRRNSIDLTDAEYEVEVEWDENDVPAVQVNFTRWNIGATTLVGKSAFPNSRAETGELVASLPADAADFEALVVEFDEATFGPRIQIDETTASLAIAPSIPCEPAAPFFIAEPPEEQPFTVHADGSFSGHLGVWGRPHRALGCPPPRSRNNYSGLMKPGPFCEFEDGTVSQVATAPLFLRGGHPKGLLGSSQDEVERAYGDVDNAWGDYRIVDGKIGPWISGRCRPGITPSDLSKALCSPISGHWLQGDLVAVVTVNVPANEVRDSRRYSYSADGDTYALEMVASFGPPVVDEPVAPEAPQPDFARAIDSIIESLRSVASDLRSPAEPSGELASPTATGALLLALDLDEDSPA